MLGIPRTSREEMATTHAESGEMIDLHSSAPGGQASRSQTLVRTDHVEVFRLALPAGKELPSSILVTLIVNRV